MANYVFVYGTLKGGVYGFTHPLLTDCEYVGVGRAHGCVLLDFGGCPGMLPAVEENRDNNALGEVYEIPAENLEAVLHRLDELEHNGKLYLRVKIDVDCNNAVMECFTYFFMVRVKPEIIVKGGRW